MKAFPLGDDLGFQTRRKENSRKGKYTQQRERNSSVSGPKAFGQARTFKIPARENKTSWRGWENEEEGGRATIIPPYDHKHVIAGQGTAGKELIVSVYQNF